MNPQASKPIQTTPAPKPPNRALLHRFGSSRNSFVMAVLIVGFLGGVLGGLLGIFALNNYLTLSGRESGRKVVLEESSAIIDVAKKLSPSVVSIVTQSNQVDIFGRALSTRASAGSGIIIRSDGLILTNKHVIPAGSDQITVVTSDNKEYKNAKVLARDPLNDLAYVKVEGSDLPAAPLGDSDKVVVGQRVVAIGNALGEFPNTVTSGIISGIGRPVIASSGLSEAERLQGLLQTDAAINPGNSGGPLVDMSGQVIGIDTAVAGGAQNIGFAIPINQAKPGVTSIQDTGKLSTPYLGVRYVQLTKAIADRQKLPVSEGAYVIGNQNQPAILPDSPAAKAGLRSGDIITKVDGQAISQTKSLTTLIGAHKVGDSVKLTFVRDGKGQEVSVTLAELPQ